MSTIEKDFCNKLFALCEKQEDLEKGLIIAFSGGCDSLALLLLATKALGPDKVYPVYVNHNLRRAEELEKEIALNEANCRKIGVKLEICTIVCGKVTALAKERSGGVEDSARVLRYELLEEKRREHGLSYIATAHHRQDQLETIAMRLAGGSPVSSLVGIAQKDEARHLIRPLLDFERKDLEEYLIKQGLSWSTDSTNADISFARNKMRNQTLPKLKDLWPEYEKALLSLSNVAKELSQRQNSYRDYISIKEFKALNPTRKTLALFDLWNLALPQTEMPMTLVSRVVEVVKEEKEQRICANGAEILVKDGSITIKALEIPKPSSEDQKKDPFYQFEVEFDPKVDQRIALPSIVGNFVLFSGNYAKPYETEKSLRMDSSKFKGNPRLRYARMGDSIKLKGGKKLVSRLLQDMKISPSLRHRVPVLVDEDGLCAVFGSCFGGLDRICVKFRSSLAPNRFTLYIVHKG